ncbi:MAG: hypothetical protein ACYDD4_07325 [Acidimicrobiales bacterium]
MTEQATPIGDVASEIAVALQHGDHDQARRCAFRAMEHYLDTDFEVRHCLVGDEPPLTGDERYDALLAGVVEHSCARREETAPEWVHDRVRFLRTWWFVSGDRGLHGEAFVHSPISFKRRGVFVTREELSHV